MKIEIKTDIGKGYIYLLEVIDSSNKHFGKKYIGQHLVTSYKISKKYFSGGVIIKRFVRKYSRNIFKKTIMVDNVPEELLNDLEIHYIRIYGTWSKVNSMGLNLTEGGKGIRGYKHSEKMKLEASLLRRGKRLSENFKKGREIWFAENGHTIGEKITRALTGKKRSEFQAKNIKDGVTKVQGVPILQYDLDGNFIAEYPSITEAKRQTKCTYTSIYNSCTNKKLRSNRLKFKWKFKNK